jgi:hypothetical protein
MSSVSWVVPKDHCLVPVAAALVSPSDATPVIITVVDPTTFLTVDMPEGIVIVSVSADEPKSAQISVSLVFPAVGVTEGLVGVTEVPCEVATLPSSGVVAFTPDHSLNVHVTCAAVVVQVNEPLKLPAEVAKCQKTATAVSSESICVVLSAVVQPLGGARALGRVEVAFTSSVTTSRSPEVTLAADVTVTLVPVVAVPLLTVELTNVGFAARAAPTSPHASVRARKSAPSLTVGSGKY